MFQPGWTAGFRDGTAALIWHLHQSVSFLFSLHSLSSVTRKCFYQPLKWFLGGTSRSLSPALDAKLALRLASPTAASVEQKKGTVKQKASPARRTITNLIRLLNTSTESRLGAFIPVSPLRSHTDIVCSLSAPAGPRGNDTNLEYPRRRKRTTKI